MSVVLYGCETWSLTLREEHKLKVTEGGAVGAGTGYGLDGGRVRSLSSGLIRNILFFTPALEPMQAIIQRVPGRWLKWPGHESDHAPQTSTEAKITWIYTSTRPYAIMA
jgi:hypothetical protein